MIIKEDNDEENKKRKESESDVIEKFTGKIADGVEALLENGIAEKTKHDEFTGPSAVNSEVGVVEEED